MLHVVVLQGGSAKSYANHWLRCARFEHERAAGHNIYLRVGDLMGMRGFLILLLTQLNPRMFPEPNEYLNYQLGNTSLAYHNGRILALMEGGMPFHVKVNTEASRLGAVESVGPYDFDGDMQQATSGHPKICPRTGEWHSFFYRCASAPVPAAAVFVTTGMSQGCMYFTWVPRCFLKMHRQSR
jgi:carotenoid cleavage dioxygenase-like enzyme